MNLIFTHKKKVETMKNYLIKTFFILTIIITSSFLEAKIAKTTKSHVKFVQNGISHIKDRHWFNASSGTNTSHFNKSMTVSKLHALATKTIKQGSVSNSKNGMGRKVHEYTFKKPIGTNSNGKKAKTLRVVTSPKGEIITAFPCR